MPFFIETPRKLEDISNSVPKKCTYANFLQAVSLVYEKDPLMIKLSVHLRRFSPSLHVTWHFVQPTTNNHQPTSERKISLEICYLLGKTLQKFQFLRWPIWPCRSLNDELALLFTPSRAGPPIHTTPSWIVNYYEPNWPCRLPWALPYMLSQAGLAVFMPTDLA